MSKKKTSNNKIVDSFDMQIFSEGDGNTTTPPSNPDNTQGTTPTTTTDPEPTTGNTSGTTTTDPSLSESGGGQSTIIGGGGSMEDGGDVDDIEDGGENTVETKTFLEDLIPGKTNSEIIQETPMPAQVFDIAKTRPTLANQIKRANNAAKTTFNYLPY